MTESKEPQRGINLHVGKKTRRFFASSTLAFFILCSNLESGVASQIGNTQLGKTFEAGRELLLAKEQPLASMPLLPPTSIEQLHEIVDPRVEVGIGDSEVWGNAWANIHSHSFLDDITEIDPNLQTVNLGKPGISTQNQSDKNSLEDFYQLPVVNSPRKYDVIVSVGGNDFQKLTPDGKQALRYQEILESNDSFLNKIQKLQFLPSFIQASVSLIHDHHPALKKLLQNIINPPDLPEQGDFHPPNTVYVLSMLPFHRAKNLCTIGFDQIGSICYRIESQEKREIVYRAGILMNQQKEAAIADASAEFPKQKIVLVNVFDLDGSIFLNGDQHLNESGDRIVGQRIVDAIHSMQYRAYLAS